MKDKLKSYEECRKRYKLGELTSREAAELCGMPQSTFVNWVKRDERQDPNEMVQVVQLCALRCGKRIISRELAQLSGVENPQFMPVNRVDGELVANLRLHYARR